MANFDLILNISVTFNASKLFRVLQITQTYCKQFFLMNTALTANPSFLTVQTLLFSQACFHSIYIQFAIDLHVQARSIGILSNA